MQLLRAYAYMDFHLYGRRLLAEWVPSSRRAVADRWATKDHPLSMRWSPIDRRPVVEWLLSSRRPLSNWSGFSAAGSSFRPKRRPIADRDVKLLLDSIHRIRINYEL